jgi:hypothetical protein
MLRSLLATNLFRQAQAHIHTPRSSLFAVTQRSMTTKTPPIKRSIDDVDNADEKPSKKQKKGTEKEEAQPLLVVPTDFTKPELKPNNLKIVSWNVASWSTIQGKGFPQYVASESPDIICVQETKVDEKRFKSDVLQGYEAYFYSCTTNPGYAGTM